MHLDGAQTFGALDVNVRAIGCDSYAASAHKWAMGPLEAGAAGTERTPIVRATSPGGESSTDLPGHNALRTSRPRGMGVPSPMSPDSRSSSTRSG